MTSLCAPGVFVDCLASWLLLVVERAAPQICFWLKTYQFATEELFVKMQLLSWEIRCTGCRCRTGKGCKAIAAV